MHKVLLERVALQPFVPDWVVRWALPEIEDVGPEHLERGDVKNYSPHDVSRIALDFFNHLQASTLVRRCLSFREGRSLIARGVMPLWFPRTHLCLWRSVGFDIFGNLYVPWIQNISGQSPVIRWWWLAYDLYPSHRTVLVDPRLLPHFGSPAT